MNEHCKSDQNELQSVQSCIQKTNIISPFANWFLLIPLPPKNAVTRPALFIESSKALGLLYSAQDVAARSWISEIMLATEKHRPQRATL